jgi:SNF2 family DNA or RNA helicase
MVTISTHKLGLVAAAEHDRPSEVGRRLRARLGHDQVTSLGRQFIVPLTAAPALVDEFGERGATWDQIAWTAASEGQSHLAAIARARQHLEAPEQEGMMNVEAEEWLTQLDVHQRQAVLAMTTSQLPGLALFDEQGTGKTITTLAAFDRLREAQVVQRLLVVAPKSVLGAWRHDAVKLVGDKYTVTVATGTAAERRHLIRSPHDVLVMSYDSAVRDRPWLQTRLAAAPGTYMLVMDESYLVKNPTTARSQTVAALRPYCERAIVLCGTPAPNRAVDVVHQIDLVDGGLAFGSLVIPHEEAAAREVIRGALGRSVVLRRLKENVLPDLPGKSLERVYVDLQPEQRARYDQARQDLILAVRSVGEEEFRRRLPSFLAQRAALLQLCSHPGVFDSGYREVPAKFLALDLLLDELSSQSLKFVVWSFYRFTLNALAGRYTHLGVARIDGSVVSAEARSQAIERFQSSPSIRMFLGNPAAAGTGITLTAAHHVLYESFSNQAAHYLQSVDRVHRRGQKHEVTYHVLLARDTLDEFEFDRLLAKERAGRDILGDEYEETPTRERFLAELGVAQKQKDKDAI